MSYLVDTNVLSEFATSVTGRARGKLVRRPLATAAQHVLFVTRNLRDVEGLGAEVLNPWEAR